MNIKVSMLIVFATGCSSSDVSRTSSFVENQSLFELVIKPTEGNSTPAQFNYCLGAEPGNRKCINPFADKMTGEPFSIDAEEFAQVLEDKKSRKNRIMGTTFAIGAGVMAANFGKYALSDLQRDFSILKSGVKKNFTGLDFKRFGDSASISKVSLRRLKNSSYREGAERIIENFLTQRSKNHLAMIEDAGSREKLRQMLLEFWRRGEVEEFNEKDANILIDAYNDYIKSVDPSIEVGRHSQILARASSFQSKTKFASGNASDWEFPDNYPFKTADDVVESFDITHHYSRAVLFEDAVEALAEANGIGLNEALSDIIFLLPKKNNIVGGSFKDILDNGYSTWVIGEVTSVIKRPQEALGYLFLLSLPGAALYLPIRIFDQQTHHKVNQGSSYSPDILKKAFNPDRVLTYLARTLDVEITSEAEKYMKAAELCRKTNQKADCALNAI